MERRLRKNSRSSLSPSSFLHSLESVPYRPDTRQSGSRLLWCTRDLFGMSESSHLFLLPRIHVVTRLSRVSAHSSAQTLLQLAETRVRTESFLTHREGVDSPWFRFKLVVAISSHTSQSNTFERPITLGGRKMPTEAEPLSIYDHARASRKVSLDSSFI